MTKPSCMTPEQYEIVHKAMDEITGIFPNLNVKEIVAGPLAEFAYGRLPDYSNLATHKVTDVTTVMVGSFVLCHAIDPQTGKRIVVLVKRGNKGPNGEDRFGVPGGYTNLDFTKGSTYTAVNSLGEQPAEGAMRELREEIVNADGSPILDIDPSRLRIIKSGIDYKGIAKGRLATQYNGHAVELTPAELNAVKKHIERLHDDPTYRQMAQEKSDGETAGVLLVELKSAAAMNENQFTHVHERTALGLLAALLSRNPGAEMEDARSPCSEWSR